MQKSLVLALLACVLLVGSACTFHGAIKEDFYQSQTEVGKKFPFKVAVLVDDHAKSVTFDNQAWHMDLDLYAAMGKAFQQELQTAFESVVVVHDKSKAQEYDLVASVNVDISAINGLGQVAQVETKVDLTLKDLRGGVTLFRESQVKKLAHTPAGVTCYFLTLFSLGLLSPVTMPCMTNAIGETTLDGIERQLPSVVRELVANAQGDARITSYAKRSSSGPEVALGVAPRPVPSSDVDRLPVVKVTSKKNAYAVVIGIERYRQQLPKADFAAHDAKVMGEYLTKVLGYSEENVVVRLNDKAAKTDMEKYLEEWLAGKVKPGDSVFVYYSGHGAPNTKSGEPYLVPYDGDPAFVESTTYPLKRLYAALDKLPAREIVVMLDSCFSGAGGRSVIAKGTRPMMLSMENPILASSKTMVLAASSGTQTSSTFEEKGHGLLTYYFLKGLQGDGDLNNDGKIDMPELFEYVRPNVESVARNQYNNEQTPQLMASPALLKNGGGRLLETSRP